MLTSGITFFHGFLGKPLTDRTGTGFTTAVGFHDKTLGLVPSGIPFFLFGGGFGGVVLQRQMCCMLPATLDFTTLESIAFGAGLRFALVPEERINLRMDFGCGFATQTLISICVFHRSIFKLFLPNRKPLAASVRIG